MKFNKMIGKSYLYNGSEYLIKDVYHISEDLYQVVTDKRAIKCREAEMRRDFLPVLSPNEVTDKLALVKGVQIETQQLQSLATILLENIQKVKTDPKFIDQAHSINESAKTIIDLKRTQIEIIRLVKD